MSGGRKIALLVGCNYPNTPYELKGCQNDVQSMKETLVSRCGFDAGYIQTVINTAAKAESIKDILKAFVAEALAGDILFFYFSGQGVKTSEAGILAGDLKIITSSELTPIVSQLSAKKVAVTIMSDSSYSAGLLKNFQNGVLLSGCRLEESRHDITDAAGNERGAFTYAVQKFLEDGPRPRTNEDVIKNVGYMLGPDQHPCLHCFPNNATANFLGDTGSS